MPERARLFIILPVDLIKDPEMLKFFRNQKNSWLMKGILTLTALSFVSLFGLSRTIERFPDEGKELFSVDGKKITVAQYVNELNQKMKSISKITGRPFTIKDADDAGFLAILLDDMAKTATSERMADRLKLTVSDDTVRDIIRNMPIFSGLDGTFSMGTYKRHLSDIGVSEKRFVSDTVTELRTRQIKDVAGTLSLVWQGTAEKDYRLQHEKRSADVFTVTPANLKIAGKPTAEEKESLYKEMTEELTMPEYRSFTVLSLTPEDIARKISVSEDELREAFNENKADYTIEEIRDVDQMLFDSQEQADEAYAALQSGKKFMEVAKTFAGQTEDQTKLGDITPSTATGDWADAVFTAKKGEIVGPVKTAFGWQILRVNKITPKIEKSFKEVRDEIERKTVAAMTFDRLSETAVALDDRFGAGETIEDVAKSTGFPVRKYTLTDSTGLFENGKAAGISRNVLATAFAMEAGKESPMTEDGTGFFVLRVDDIRDPAVKPMEKSEKEIMAAWVAERQKEEAKKIIEKIEDELDKGTNPKLIAQKTGAQYKRVNGLTRKDGKHLPSRVVYSLFNKPVGSVVTQTSGKEYLAAKTVSAKQADPKKDVIGVAEIRQQMQADMAKEKEEVLLSDFGFYLHSKIHHGTIQKTFSHLVKSAQENEAEDD